MFSHKLLFLAGMLLFAQGCAYSSAMSSGARLESSGDWTGAYRQYEAAAKKKPDEPEASEARDRMRAAIVEGALGEARAALNGADFETTMEKLAFASSYDGDRPEVFELKSATKVAMTQRYHRFVEANDYKGAYDIAVRTKTLVPTAEVLEEAFPTLREHFNTRARKQLRAKEFPEALATLRTIVEFEPDRKADIAELEQNILTDWGSDQAKQAQNHVRYRRRAAGAIHYARAYEIAGNTSYLDQSRALTQQLQPEGQLSVQLRTSGSKDRIQPFLEALNADLAGIPNVEVVPSRAKLVVRLDFRSTRCTEEDAVTPTEKDYISGQIEEPNPVFHELTASLAKERELEAEAKRKAEAIWPAMIDAEKTLKLSDADHRDATAARDTAKSALSDAEERLTRTKALGADLKAKLEAATAAGDSTTVEATQKQLADLAPIERSWVDEVFKRGDVLSEAERKLAGIETDRGPAKEAAERLRSGHDALVADKTAAASKASELSTKLSSTKSTVWNDVHELLTYDIHDYTRTCIAPLSTTLQPTWETKQPTSEVFAPSNTTKDRAHIGHDKAEVKQDPKAFPESDAELIAKGDEESRKKVQAWLTSVADDHFAVRRMQTTLDLVEHPLDPTELVRLYVGAPGRLDEADLTMFASHLKTHFGLEKIELLRAP